MPCAHTTSGGGRQGGGGRAETLWGVRGRLRKEAILSTSRLLPPSPLRLSRPISPLYPHADFSSRMRGVGR
eukprot:3157349-Rhodomonas_salina.2